MWIPLALALLAQSPAVDPPQKGRRVGVGNLDVTDVTPAVRSVVEEALVVELRKLSRTSVIAWAEIKQMLDVEATKQTLGCGVDGACLAEIADAAGVDDFVAGSLVSTAEESVLVLSRIDQKEARVVGKVQKRLQPQHGEEWLAAIGPAVAELFPEVPLRPGATRGVDPKLAVRLNPPPLPSWTPWAAGGVTAALGLVTAGAGVLWQAQQADYRALVATKGVLGSQVVEKGNATTTSEAAMWTFAGLTLAGVAATAASVPFTNFDDATGGAE
jgi:hypothetical protein